MKRLPLIPTIIVAAAIAVMIGLGVWQLQRAQWKNELLAQYSQAAAKPPVAWPTVPVEKDAPLFRRATGYCLSVTGWSSSAGRNRRGESGWSHTASCRTGGAEGPGMQVDMGWSRDPANPRWSGGKIDGVIAPDSKHVIRLVSDTPAPGLEASAPPNPEDIPNNHLSYAVQWFLFAAVAGVIYVLALRRRSSSSPSPDGEGGRPKDGGRDPAA
jgi:surfeit locus 1 family protein